MEMGRKSIKIILIVLLASAGWFIFLAKEEKNIPPPVLETNFVDLSYIQKISKFRSCQGHTVVPQNKNEMRRNMKHYYWVKDQYLGKEIPIHAPFEGKITLVMTDPKHGLEGEIWISNGNEWQFSVQHVYPEKNIRRGARIRKGQLLGNVKTQTGSFDIVYAKQGFFPKKVDGWTSPYSNLDSVFNHMSDEAWAPYAKSGLTKEILIISRGDRDAQPCIYDTSLNAQAAQLMNNSNIEDWVDVK